MTKAVLTDSRANSRDTILDVSTTMFAERGLNGVTMRQIATAASVTLPTIYHYFSNKDALYRAVEGELYSLHAEALIEALRSPGASTARLRKFMRAIFDTLVENPLYFRIMLRGLIENDQDNHQFLASDALQPVADELQRLLEEIRTGSGANVTPLYIFGAILGFLSLRSVASMLEGHEVYNRKIQEQGEMLIDTIMRSVVDD